jgi:acyl carrier protein
MNEQIKALVAEYFKIDPAVLTDESGPGRVEGWDSLGQVGLMSHLEQKLGLQFDIDDIVEMDTIASMAHVIGRLKG